MSDTYKHTEKIQVSAIFRDIAIRILVKVHFCESKLYKAKKCAFVENCLGRELKGIASFPASTSSPRHYYISEETISRTVSLKGKSPVQCLQVSVSRPPTVDGTKMIECQLLVLVAS